MHQNPEGFQLTVSRVVLVLLRIRRRLVSVNNLHTVEALPTVFMVYKATAAAFWAQLGRLIQLLIVCET
jgi:hypothetical protein